VLWEILSGEEPYEGMGRVEAAIAVVTRGLRPPIDPQWQKEWVHLMEWCWDEDPKHRPSFKKVLDFLAHTF